MSDTNGQAPDPQRVGRLIGIVAKYLRQAEGAHNAGNDANAIKLLEMATGRPIGDEYTHDVPESVITETRKLRDRKRAKAIVDAEPDPDAPPAPKIWRATDLKPAKQPRWLAKNRIPRAAVSLIIGEEGIGKSLLWIWLATAVTTGKPLPGFDVPARPPGRVLLAAITEDDWCSVVAPRLEVAGANVDRITVICTEADGSGSAVFPRDIALIRDADPVPDLVMVDAWLDTVPAGLQVKDPQQARLALHPWKELATATEAAVVLLCHTNRLNTPNPRESYGATAALRQKARMSLYCLTDADTGNLIVGPEKANGAAAVTASTFDIKSVQYWPPTPDDDGTVPKLVYSGETLEVVRDIIAEAYAANHSVRKGAGEVADWLDDQLANGPRWYADLRRAGETAGYSKDQLDRAKSKIRAESKKAGGAGGWFWTFRRYQDRTPAPVYPLPLSCDLAQNDENQDSASTFEDSKRADSDRRAPNCDLGSGAAPITCRHCGADIPETAPLARERGYCNKATCIATANNQREEPDE